MVNAGILREVITILKLETTQDSYGDIKQVYSPFMTLRASIKYAGGSKTSENFEAFNTKSIVFTTYVRPIDESMRIGWKGDTYIINQMPMVNYDWLEISAERLKD